MKINIKGKIWRITFAFLIGFAVLFVFRLIYGYTSKFKERDHEYFGSFFDDGMTKRNYASSKYGYTKSHVEVAGDVAVATEGGATHYDIDQKYEKTSEVKAKSENFGKDKKTILDTIKQYNAIIQYENNAGSKGNRAMDG